MPCAEASVKVPCEQRKPKPGAEYFLRIFFTLKSDTRWAKKGLEIASAQFKLPAVEPAPVADVATMKPVTLAQDEKSATVTGDGFAVVFDKAAGTISRLERKGVNILAPDGGPQLHLWRCPHRNDDMWAAGGWDANGLDKLAFSASGFKAEQAGPAAVRVSALVRAKGDKKFSVTNDVTYTVFGDGSVAVDNDVQFAGPKIALARVGVRMLLDKSLDTMKFLGRGPGENYSDRKCGSDVGLYTIPVNGQYAYEKPMERGNHEDVRWAALTGRGVPGLLVQADEKLMQVAALPHTDEQMMPHEYKIDLPASTATVLTIGHRTTGVGSAGCGPKPLGRYIVSTDPARFSYVLRLLPTGKKADPELGRAQAPARQTQPRPAAGQAAARHAGWKAVS